MPIRLALLHSSKCLSEHICLAWIHSIWVCFVFALCHCLFLFPPSIEPMKLRVYNFFSSFASIRTSISANNLKSCVQRVSKLTEMNAAQMDRKNKIVIRFRLVIMPRVCSCSPRYVHTNIHTFADSIVRAHADGPHLRRRHRIIGSLMLFRVSIVGIEYFH